MNVVEENNKANMVTQGTTTAVFGAYFHTAYLSMLPWLFAAIPLILIDLNLGRKKAKLRYAKTHKNEDKVTINKSVRMTIDKTFSYICWIMLSTSLAIAFSCDVVKYVIMAIIYGLEVWSILRSYLLTKGFEVSDVDLFRLLCKLVWNKLTGMQEDFKTIIKEKENDKNDTRV